MRVNTLLQRELVCRREFRRVAIRIRGESKLGGWVPELMGRDFAAELLNRKWYGDGSEVVTA